MPIRKKLVVVGDGMCGKTCLLVTFSRDQFPTVYVPTVFETFVADMTVDDQEIELSLWDTAGQEDFDKLRPFSYPESDVILIVFSIDSKDSLENVVEKWTPELNHYCNKVNRILVGTKKDLRYTDEGRGKVLVPYEEGRKVCDKIKACGYIECSSLYRDGVQEVFEAAVRASLKRKKNSCRTCVLV